MRFLLRLPVIRALHHRQLLFPVALVLVAIIFLILGALEQRDIVQGASVSPIPEPAEVTRSIIRADLDKTPLTYFADYWTQLAEQASRQLVSVGTSKTPGIVVGPRLVLTTIEPALEVFAAQNRANLIREVETENVETENVETENEETENEETENEETLPLPELGPYRLIGWDAEIGLALFNVTGQELIPFTLTDPRAMPSGSYVGAVSLSEVGDATVAPGYFVAIASRDLAVSEFGDLVVSMDLPEMSPPAAFVNLDGAFLGLSYEIPNGRRVISTTEILSLIEKLQAETVCRSVEVVTLDENVRQGLVIEDGVLIEYVHREAFRSKSALLGGDVLLEWAGEKLESVEQFERLYDAQIPGESVEFLVLRNRRRISGDAIVPDTYCEPVESTPIRFDAWGLVLQWVPETRDELRQSVVPSGWLVMVVFEDSPSALAGIEENDLLLTVGGAMVATEQDREIIEKSTERSEPVLLSVRRGDRMKLVALVPSDQQTSPDFQ